MTAGSCCLQPILCLVPHSQRLHRLDRRTRKHRPGDVAGRRDDVALGVGDHERAAVPILDIGAARLLDEDGVGVQTGGHDWSRKKRPGGSLGNASGPSSQSIGGQSKARLHG